MLTDLGEALVMLRDVDVAERLRFTRPECVDFKPKECAAGSASP